MVKTNNNILSFSFKLFKICCYLQLKLSDINFYSQISKKLIDSSTIHKAYWSFLKAFLNSRKTICIPPVFHNNKFISNLKDKAT